MGRIERERSALREELPPIDRREARTILAAKLDELAGRYGFAYNRLYVRNQRTLWGSCSSKNNISLNMNLVRLPAELIEYVILHELVHTRVRNHGPSFWAELEKIAGDPQPLRKKLRAYHPEQWA